MCCGYTLKSSSRAHPPTPEYKVYIVYTYHIFRNIFTEPTNSALQLLIIPVASPQQGAYTFGRSWWLYSFFCDPGLSATRSLWHLSAMLRDTVASAFLPRSAAHMM